MDPKDGRILLSRALKPGPTLERSGVRAGRPMFISNTHLFTGSRSGHLLVFARKTGKYEWSFKPKGAGGTCYTANYFVSAAGRLFYGDVSGRVYCLIERGEQTQRR